MICDSSVFLTLEQLRAEIQRRTSSSPCFNSDSRSVPTPEMDAWSYTQQTGFDTMSMEESLPYKTSDPALGADPELWNSPVQQFECLPGNSTYYSSVEFPKAHVQIPSVSTSFEGSSLRTLSGDFSASAPWATPFVCSASAMAPESVDATPADSFSGSSDTLFHDMFQTSLQTANFPTTYCNLSLPTSNTDMEHEFTDAWPWLDTKVDLYERCRANRAYSGTALQRQCKFTYNVPVE